MPVELVGNLAEAVAFDGARNDRLRLSFDRLGAVERSQHGGHIVPVNHLRIEAFRFEFQPVALHIVLVHGWFALAEPVDVRDHGEVIEVVVRRQKLPLPIPALRLIRRRL